jgi:sulfatase modifying factor 1
MHLLILVTLACVGPKDSAAPLDTGDSDATGDTGDTGDTGSVERLDRDGDGWYAPADGIPQAEIDCDDADPYVTPELWRYIPAGPFLRGDDDHYATSPQREIQLSAYCMQVYEVTVVDYASFLEAAWDEGGFEAAEDGLYGLDGALWVDTVDGDDPVPERITWDGGVVLLEGYELHPMNEVTYAGSRAYCQSLGGDLPTEAQWEKAARGGCELGSDASRCDDDDARSWPWGDEEVSCELANYSWVVGYSDDGMPNAFEHCIGDTLEVGSYPGDTSPYGLRDVAGNISELVLDWFDEGYYAESPDSDPMGPDEGGFMDPTGGWVEARVARGAGWAGDVEFTTTFARTPEPVGTTSNGMGLRCALPQ